MLATATVSPAANRTDSTGRPRSRWAGLRSIMKAATEPSGNANARPRDVSSSRPRDTSTRPGNVLPCKVQITGS